MKYLLIGAAAAMALVGAATIGNAQTQDDKGKRPAAEGKDPASESKGTQREPRADKDQQSQKPAPNRTAEPRPDGKTEAQDGPRRQGSERESGKDQPKVMQQSKDKAKSADAPKPDKDQPKAMQQQPKDQPKSTEGPQPGKDQQKSTQGQGTDERQGTRAQVSEQQRTGVRERLTKESRVERTKINVSVNIGAPIPRSVRLHTLPITIVSLAPAYRGYSYIVLEDETICIVDERTYLIVDVIPSGSQRAVRPGRAQLALSSEQARFIFASVPKDRPTNVRVRLALGAEVPRDVQLLAFPADVLERVPEVGRYRYIVAGNDVVIVDANDNAVVLVINE
jgi:hypothetical protein